VGGTEEPPGVTGSSGVRNEAGKGEEDEEAGIVGAGGEKEGTGGVLGVYGFGAPPPLVCIELTSEPIVRISTFGVDEEAPAGEKGEADGVKEFGEKDGLGGVGASGVGEETEEEGEVGGVNGEGGVEEPPKLVPKLIGLSFGVSIEIVN